MRLRVLLCCALLVIIAACQGPPPTVFIVVTATPAPAEGATEEVTAVVTAEMTTEAVAATAETSPEISLTVTNAATQTPAATAPTLAPGEPTPLPPGFPTPIVTPIQVAEQLFEHGRMFWLQPTNQIWVLIITAEGRGDWIIYEDTFIEGEPETDPSLVPPEGRYQPERGFGKLWREVPDLRETLGWGVTPEFGYISRYEYHVLSTGSTNAGGTSEPAHGYHVLYSLGGEQFRFNEIDSTWQLGGG